MKTALEIALLLVCIVMALRQSLLWLTRPLSRDEESKRFRLKSHLRNHAKASEKALREGRVPTIWVPKIYGPLGVRGFRAAEYVRAWRERRASMLAWAMGLNLEMARMANAAEGFSDGGLSTYYPADVVPGGTSSNPYYNRYMLVKQAPAGTTLAASLVPAGLTVSSDDMCFVMAAGDVSVPLGVMTDDVGNAPLDAPPYSGNVTYLGNAAKSTQQMVTDSLIVAGQLLTRSSTTAGYVGVIPNIAGAYWSPGFTVSTSEGAGTLVEVDAHRIPVSVDEIT